MRPEGLLSRMLVPLCLLVCLLTPQALADTDRFANPLDVLAADPFVFREDDVYYLYGTAAGDGLLVWTSQDLINWRLRGHVLRRSADTWSREHFWAPELFAHGGKYYLHFTALGGEPMTRRLVLAEGDSPLGPFREVRAPWFEPGRDIIDSHVFRDDDGQLYLYAVYFGREGSPEFEIHAWRLDDDLTLDGESTFCIKPSGGWEGSVVNEGPFVLRHGDSYLLTYSANGFHDPNYSVGFATGPSPMGPWTKSEDGPVLRRRENVSGPGHHCFTTSPDGDELLIVYHTHQQHRQPGGPRQVAIDRARIVVENGAPRLTVDGPTVEPRALPSGADAFACGQSDEFDGAAIDRRRWTVFNERPSEWTLRDGRLTINTRNGDVHELRSDLSNLFLQYAPAGDFDVTTRVSFRPGEDFEQAMLCLWQDHNHYVKLAIVHARAPRIEIGVETDGIYESTLKELDLGEDSWLRIGKRGDTYQFQVSADGEAWTSLGTQKVRLHDLRAGIGAAAPVSGRSIPATFDFLRFSAP